MKSARIAASIALFVFLGFITGELHAGPIVGSQVTGSLRFGSDTMDVFDPVNKLVPNGVLNKAGTTVLVSAAQTEFGFKDSISFYTADFTDTQLVILDPILGGSNKFTMIFTDDAFIGATLAKTSDNFTNGGLTATLAGSTITVTWVGTQGTPLFKTLKATFDVTPAAAPTATPEPTSLIVFGMVGAVGVIVWRLRVRRKAASRAA